MENIKIDYADVKDEEIKKTLLDLVSFPTVTREATTEVFLNSANYIIEKFKEIGFENLEILYGKSPDGKKSRPCIFGEIKSSNPNAKTILLYAHHDVQPVKNDWDQKSPFELHYNTQEQRLYGRGAADDKSGITVYYHAIKHLQEKNINIPVNLKLFIDGEEETGSNASKHLFEEYKEKLGATVCCVCDTDNESEENPSLTISVRGHSDVFVEVNIGKDSLHSGAFGGPITDAASIFSFVYAKAFDENGSFAIDPEENKQVVFAKDNAEIQEETFREQSGINSEFELLGTGKIADRLWNKVFMSIVGINYPKLDQANAITPTITAQLNLRIPPGIDAQKVYTSVKNFFENNAPFGSKITVSTRGISQSCLSDVNSKYFKNFSKAIEYSWGKTPIQEGLGGSVGIVEYIQKIGAMPIFFGCADKNSKTHETNESVSIPIIKKTIVSLCEFLKNPE